MKRGLGVAAIIVLIVALAFLRGRIIHATDQALHGPYTIQQRIDEYGPTVDARLRPDFARAGVAYPPAQITLVILKQEREVQLDAADANAPFRYIRTYPIFAASGHLGPKLREGDWQVPEGVYRVESLNPNSLYHLALHVGYPNAFDRAHAQADGRTQLGGDIMIHGSNVSIGCVALGDRAAEDLFVLVQRAGLPNVKLLFCPFDLRTHPASVPDPSLPAWTAQLYASLGAELMKLPASPLGP